MLRDFRNLFRCTIHAATLALVALPAAAPAQDAAPGPEAGRVYRIGLITYAGPGGGGAIKRELASLGYREGENVIYEERAGNRDLAAMDRLAEELVAWPTRMSRSARPLSTIPFRWCCGPPIPCRPA